MKKLFQKITAIIITNFTVGFMLISAALPVSAEEYNEAVMLPSGINTEEFNIVLEDLNRGLGGSEPGFASAAVGVFIGDEVVYTGYFGEIDMKKHIRADESSVYEWGSISKTLIWVSAMQLWEQGRLDLDRDVREYLPDGFFRNLSYDDPITMLNLMNHNAGWQETARPMWKTNENEILPLGEELQAIEPAQIHRPGEVAAYSNYGAALAGYIIECITGQDFCAYVHENIFDPLGMEHTSLNPTHSDNAWVYEHRKNTKSYQFSLGYCIDLGSMLDYVAIYPAGAAAGTLSDLMIYAQALVNDSAPLFQSKETRDLMFTGTDFYGESDIPICAHGFWYQEYAVRVCGHNGATTAGQANMAFDLESGTGLVVMVNEPDGNSFLNGTPALVFGMLSDEKYASGSAKKASLSGYYLSARSTHRGLLKFLPYLTAISASNPENAVDLGNGVYLVEFSGERMLTGIKTYPDGGSGFQLTSMDLIHDSFYLAKLCLFALYLLTAVAAVYLLLIAHKLKKHNRQTNFNSSAVVTAGRIARIASVFMLILSFVVYQTTQGGIPFATGAIIGITQMICAAVCGISAVGSLIPVFSGKTEKAVILHGVLNTVGCVLPIIAIVFFEMYRFWGI